MRRSFILFVLFVSSTEFAFAGSQIYSSPGSYTFTVPAFSSLTVQVWGAGGGGASMHSPYSGSIAAGSGGYSAFGSVIGYGGAGSRKWECIYDSEGTCYSPVGGEGGSASGGTTNISGGDGTYYYGGASPNGGAGGANWTAKASADSEGNYNWLYCSSGCEPDPGGTPGGGGGANYPDFYQHGGGGGGYATRTYSAGELSVGSSVSVIVGSGGAGQTSFTGYPPYYGAPGAGGQVTITWSDPPAPSCTVNVSPSAINQGSTATLSWSSSNASTLYIYNVGYVPLSGSTAVGSAATYSAYATGPGGGASCSGSQTLTVYQPCSLPWGGSIAHGQSTTAYQNSTVPYGSSCMSQIRSCSNGTLSGSYPSQSCTEDSAASCTIDGETVAHGESRTFYSQTSASTGQLCSSISESRSCDNGTLSGSSTYQYSTCTCASQYYCSGSDITYMNDSCDVSVVNTCAAPLYCSAGSPVCQSPEPAFISSAEGSGHLEVRPTLVRPGETSRIYWNVGNVESCTVLGDNGDSWIGLSSGVSGQTTNSITRRTAYTLSCEPIGSAPFSDETVFVNLIPTFLEI